MGVIFGSGSELLMGFDRIKQIIFSQISVEDAFRQRFWMLNIFWKVRFLWKMESLWKNIIYLERHNRPSE